MALGRGYAELAIVEAPMAMNEDRFFACKGKSGQAE